MRFTSFERGNGKRVFCVRDRQGGPGRSYQIIVLPEKAKGYHLYPDDGYLVTCLLRESGLSERMAEKRATIIAATPLLQRKPPFEVCESELRALIIALEPFMSGDADGGGPTP